MIHTNGLLNKMHVVWYYNFVIVIVIMTVRTHSLKGDIAYPVIQYAMCWYIVDSDENILL